MGRLGAAMLGLLLAGCATVPDDFTVGDDWPARWTLYGRLALSNGREGGSGELVWRQGDRHARLQFVGALGRGSWELRQEPGRAELLTAAGEHYAARDVATLLRRHFGWNLPVSALGHWVQGRPEPGVPVADLAEADGRTVAFTQHGWQVEIGGYRQADDGWRPTRLTAVRGLDRVKLAIRSWQLP